LSWDRALSTIRSSQAQWSSVAINVRESAIEHLASHKRINSAQAVAGDRFRRLWEQAAIGAVKAIDPTKDAVDGGAAGDLITDVMLAASEELKRALQAIGPIGSRVLISVIEEGSIEKAANKWSRTGCGQRPPRRRLHYGYRRRCTRRTGQSLADSKASAGRAPSSATTSARAKKSSSTMTLSPPVRSARAGRRMKSVSAGSATPSAARFARLTGSKRITRTPIGGAHDRKKSVVCRPSAGLI
jgi:hypothetical protein